MVYETLKKIKNIQRKNYVQEPFDEEDCRFLETCLKEKTKSRDIVIPALVALMESTKESVLFFVQIYPDLDIEIKKLAIPMLVCTDEVATYVMLLHQLSISEIDDEVTLIMYSMAETHFPVIPLIVQALITDNTVYLQRLKMLLKIMGIQKLRPFLTLSPHIPFETIFIEIFGETIIKQIK